MILRETHQLGKGSRNSHCIQAIKKAKRLRKERAIQRKKSSRQFELSIKAKPLKKRANKFNSNSIFTNLKNSYRPCNFFRIYQ